MAAERAEQRTDQLRMKVELAWLTAFYGGLLTERQRRVLELHCEEDYSYAEIAEAVGISRQAVHEQLKAASQKLFGMEEKLGMAGRFRRMQAGLETCRELLRQGSVEEAQAEIDRLISLDQEDNHGL